MEKFQKKEEQKSKTKEKCKKKRNTGKVKIIQDKRKENKAI
jgi:hypothetical protein